MANAPQMKIPIGADTQDFEKGARKVKQEMRDLNKVGSDAFAAIGNALGVDVGKIQQFGSALGGLRQSFKQMGDAGTSSFSAVAKSIAPVAAGIAGLGLAAAIAAFRQLNAEADAFESTIQGGIIKAQTDAYLSTFRQSLRDQTGTGERMSKWREENAEAWARFRGIWQSGFNIERMDEASRRAERSKQIAGELYDLDLKRKANAVEVSRIDAQIAEQREIIYNKEVSREERAQALAKAQQLIKDKLDLQLPVAERMRDLIIENNSLSETQHKELDEQYAAEILVNSLITQEASEQRSLLRQQNQINAAAALETGHREETVSAIQKEVDALLKVAQEESILYSGFITSDPKALRNPARVSALSQKVAVPTELIKPDNLRVFRADILEELGGGISVMLSVDPDSVQKIHDISNEVTSIAQNMAVNIGESIGNLFADLATGENAWSNFGNAALSAFGDMAISVGKIAIEMGLASEGIQAALKLDNPYVAIAAGVALVALGTAVKSGLANVANGNYSANANVASNATSSINNGYEQRAVYVNVQGVLRADGDELLAVINSADKKNQLTT